MTSEEGAAKKQKALDLHALGKDVGKISDSLGVYRDTVRKWLRDEGLEPIKSPVKGFHKLERTGRFAHLK